MDNVRIRLREYYRTLKSCDEYISFIFVTGITKNVEGGLYSAFNSPRDISNHPDYGAITGFTHDEISRYYGRKVEEVAEYRNLATDELLEEMKKYYNGFCFDGKTFVYNPYSTLLFFEEKEFDTFWYNSGTPNQLISFLKEKKLDVTDFHGKEISRKRITKPGVNRFIDPYAYLYQLGYLSLRPSPSKDMYVLDYPNQEVTESLAKSLAESYLGSAAKVQEIGESVRKALLARDYLELIEQFNELLKNLPFSYYYPQPGEKNFVRNEAFYCRAIFIIFYMVGAIPLSESPGYKGKPDFVIKFSGQTWVIELKMNKKGRKDVTRAREALKQILARDYGGPRENPVLLGITVNDDLRQFTACACRNGVPEKPEVHRVETTDQREVIDDSVQTGTSSPAKIKQSAKKIKKP
jgi:hypothetical protein